jgi:hypothetical protein
MSLTKLFDRYPTRRVALVAFAVTLLVVLSGAGRVANAATSATYPEHAYYVNCSGILLDTGLKGPFVSVLPLSLKGWPGIDVYVINPSGASYISYSGEYIYYRAYVAWLQNGIWNYRYAGIHFNQGAIYPGSLQDGTFQYRVAAGFPSGAMQVWMGQDAQGNGIWMPYGGGTLSISYPQAEYGESWVELKGPIGTKYWVGVQTVWGQVEWSRTGLGMPGLPTGTSEYLATCTY